VSKKKHRHTFDKNMADNFAKKMLEKYGWKEGSGLGKDEQGMATALKPRLKSGKEGMGYELGKDLTDTWWTKAYSDSLRRVQVCVEDEDESAEEVTRKKKKRKHDKDKDTGKDVTEEGPTMQKMKERMMKANFTSFSKGGTLLTNGEVVGDREESQHDDSPKRSQEFLSDEELLKACGGRTAHKAARFGLKLNGKLARIAKQEEEEAQSLRSAPFISNSLSCKNKCSSRSDSNEGDLDLSLDTDHEKNKKRKSKKQQNRAS